MASDDEQNVLGRGVDERRCRVVVDGADLDVDTPGVAYLTTSALDSRLRPRRDAGGAVVGVELAWLVEPRQAATATRGVPRRAAWEIAQVSAS